MEDYPHTLSELEVRFSTQVLKKVVWPIWQCCGGLMGFSAHNAEVRSIGKRVRCMNVRRAAVKHPLLQELFFKTLVFH